ncbi:response regulator [Lichenihabitans sp. Uapishka_5]|uniref:response regulator n=1 Tax=Lichenihabitans sp. Uapishka_5 TaxID=3037302 RepID=UPI0029E8015A|nr:response regulator [Lichenihabitans sp. Uapishka_5]MDX7950474.1 response regulator [Lichenihabitans sp. Uapishka_5]
MDSPQASPAPCALVVDDDDMLRMDIAEMLESVGFCTLQAEDGDAAIEVLENHHLDVVLMFSDVEMPGSRDGFALAREVAVKWANISIVVASGRIKPGDGDLPEGAHFIGKPFSAEVVHGHLREILPDEQKPAPLQN